MSETSTPCGLLVGRVKWFNNKAGYGFITVTCKGDYAEKDIFVHHVGLNVESKQYKYLVQGEYVEFNLSKSDKENHEYQALNVNGINGGKLMCETKYLVKQSKTPVDSPTLGTNKVVQIQQEPLETVLPTQRKVRARDEGSRTEATEWSVVSKPSEKKRGRPSKKSVVQSSE
jgi:cold shock CspA family protein